MAISTAPAVPSLRRDGDDITDHDLVARVRAGDDRAFERLYRRYHRRIAAYIQGMVHDHARAEDVAQDVFMSALRRMRETDRPIAFKPWIYEIAKNACIDQFRRSRRAEEVSYDAEDGGLGSADYGKLVTTDPGPDVAVENKQSLDHLCGAFGGLSETHHEILVMRELEGLSYREIGERLGMTRPAVESTLFRARRRLTEEYEELVTGERCQRVQGIITLAIAGDLGARDKRRLARHVSYCQPCLRQARMSGLSGEHLVQTPLRQKIAALLPLPAFLKKKLSGGSVGDGPDMSSVALWSAHAGHVDPGVVSSWGKAAATAATVVIAGVGAGAATGPARDAGASLSSRGLIEHVTGRGGGSSAANVALPAPAPAAVVAAPAAPAPSQGKDRAGRPGRSSAGASSPGSTSGSKSTGSSPPAGSDHGQVASSGADAAEVPGPGSDPVSETVRRVAGGGASGGAGPSTAGGTAEAPDSGAGSAPRGPQITLPTLLPGAAPSAPAPATSSQAPAAPPQDPVGDTVKDAGSKVQDATGAVTDALNGLLGGQ